MATTYLDGIDALMELLNGFAVRDPRTGELVAEPATTYETLPADFADLAASGKVLIGVSRAGWDDDKQQLDGHDRIMLEVYGPSRTVVKRICQGIEAFLVDSDHDVPGVGFIDDVLMDSRYRMQPAASDNMRTATAVYRLISRPD